MAKVTTSEGGIQSTQVIADPKRPVRQAAAPLEMKAGDGAAPPVVDGPGARNGNKDNAVVSKGVVPESSGSGDGAVSDQNDGVDAEDRDLSDITVEEAQKKARQKITKYANRWQTELRAKEKLAEEVAESERFGEMLFNERESYRKKAEAAEARAAALEAKAPKAPEFVAPDEKDAKYYNDKGEFQWKAFSTDNAAYEAKKAIQADRTARATEEARVKQEAESQAFKDRIAKASTKYPDWEKIVTASPIMLPNEALAYITQSDYGTDIAYFLAKHPDVGDKIKAMHPIRAIAAIRDIETGFEKPVTTATPAPDAPSKQVERQGAPAPITPIVVSGTTPVQLDPAKMDFKQLRAYERERAHKRR